jgi:hypothetical protein
VRARQDRVDEALHTVGEAIVLAERLNEVYAQAVGYQQLGELYALRDEHQLVDEAFGRALDILEQAGFNDRRVECLEAYRTLKASRMKKGLAAER